MFVNYSMQLLKNIILIISLIILSGCARTIQNSYYADNQFKNDSSTKIIITRSNEPISMGVPYKIYDNNSYMGQLGPGGTLKWHRPPGQLVLTSPASMWKAKWEEGGLRINVAPYTEYSFKIYASNTITHTNTRKLSQPYKKEKKIIVEEKSQNLEFCNKQFMILTFIGDKYTVTEGIKERIENECSDTDIEFISPIVGLKYLNNNNLELDDVDLLHLNQMGIDNNLDFIIHGDVFTIEKEFVYNAGDKNINYETMGKSRDAMDYLSYMNKTDDLTELVDLGFWSFMESNQRNSAKEQEKYRRGIKNQEFEQAKNEAGTWVCTTAFIFDVKTTEKIYFYKNTKLFKL